jgi:hypothetical protein
MEPSGKVLLWEEFVGANGGLTRGQVAAMSDDGRADYRRKLGELEEAYLRRLRETTGLGDFSEEWIRNPGYLVPTETGPRWVVGQAELVVAQVATSSIALRLPNGALAAYRPKGQAEPDITPARWSNLLAAVAVERAGLLWTGPGKKR